jgi:hypothetical protein
MYNCLTKQASPTLIINFCFLKIYLLSFIDWQRISAKSCSPNPPELFPQNDLYHPGWCRPPRSGNMDYAMGNIGCIGYRSLRGSLACLPLDRLMIERSVEWDETQHAGSKTGKYLSGCISDKEYEWELVASTVCDCCLEAVAVT